MYDSDTMILQEANLIGYTNPQKLCVAHLIEKILVKQLQTGLLSA